MYEQIKELGIPLIDGGLVDQPHIFIELYAVCATRMKMWDRIEETAMKAAQNQKLLQSKDTSYGDR